MNIIQVLLPRGLDGCEAIIVGSAHWKRMRSHVMKALRNRTSPHWFGSFLVPSLALCFEVQTPSPSQ